MIKGVTSDVTRKQKAATQLHFTFAKLCLPASWLEHFYLGGELCS